MTAKEKIIIPLDVGSEYEATELVRELKDFCGAFKVGLQLFNSVGPRIFESIKAAGAERIFYDGKFHDIPNTVAGASRAAVRMGIWMFNIHTLGGSAMISAATDAANDEACKLGVEPPLVIGVTVLTSISQEILSKELCVTADINHYVSHLADMGKCAGLDGVVASAHEIEDIKSKCGAKFIVVTPGVRPSWAAADDQKRITTPASAFLMGSDYLVIGRAITSAKDKSAAAMRVIDELERAAKENNNIGSNP